MSTLRKRHLEVVVPSDSNRQDRGPKSIKTGNSSRTWQPKIVAVPPNHRISTLKQTRLAFSVVNSSSDEDGSLRVSKRTEKVGKKETGTPHTSVPISVNANKIQGCTNTRGGHQPLHGNHRVGKNFRIEIPRRATRVSPKKPQRYCLGEKAVKYTSEVSASPIASAMHDSKLSVTDSITPASPSRTNCSKIDIGDRDDTFSSPQTENYSPSIRVLPKRSSRPSVSTRLRYTLSTDDESNSSDAYATSSITSLDTDVDDLSIPDAESTDDNVDSSSENEDPSPNQAELKKQNTKKQRDHILSTRKGLLKSKAPNRRNLSLSAQINTSDSSSDLMVSSDERPHPTRGNPPKTTPDSWAYKEGVASDLPPLHTISEIFADMAEKAIGLGFKKVSDQLSGRKLKVATMCSGTESPILCLKEMCHIFTTQLGINFDFEHIFSAEIVPFKQAYIERNFYPPILFRDIRQLAKMDAAETAYGAPTVVPSGVDLVVAGFSCVDFSKLNRHPKSLDEIGESSDTLRAILSYADKYRTPLFVLENVCLAPWSKIQSMWEDIEYEACFIKVDTKKYYIPHTRQRGYIICIDKRMTKGFQTAPAALKWAELMKRFERPASSPVNEFLLHPDDPRLHRATEEMTRGAPGEEKVVRDVDWSRCQGRHHYYRDDNNLGNSRPVTEWIENSSSRMLDFGNRPWMSKQVDRVKDTVEVSWLRNARRGYDTGYKTRVLDLSQNVDRNTDTTPFGLTGCITPSGQPFLSTRGGPIVGLESLMLQGIPIDRLILTRETQANLQDLAGNAMSSTVVGAAILSALIAAHPVFPKATGKTVAINASVTPPNQRITDISLRTEKIDFGSHDEVSVTDLQTMAKNSARRCQCEGQTGKTTARLLLCKACSHTVCEKCGGIPRHEYTDLNADQVRARIETHDFTRTIKKALPMRLCLTGLDKQVFEKAKTSFQEIVVEDDWRVYTNAVLPVLHSELRFHSIRRTQSWTILFEASRSRMELVFGDNRPEWFLYAKPDSREAGTSKVRRLLEQPVARMMVESDNLLKGSWRLRVPTRLEYLIAVEGKTSLISSWNSRLGLAEYRDQKVWSELRIDVVDRQITQRYDIDISGDYKLLPNCSTASGGLHRRTLSSKGKPLYLFLDPGHITNPIDDHFVVSSDISRLTAGETRHITARLDKILKNGREGMNWRQSCEQEAEEVRCTIFEQWANVDVTLGPVLDSSATYGVPCKDFAICIGAGATRIQSLDNTGSGCKFTLNSILSCRVPLGKDENLGWPTGTWTAVDRVNEREQFESLAWLTERIRSLDGFSNEWRPLQLSSQIVKCQECAPNRPEIKWKLEQSSKGARYIPYEDMAQAGPYERAVKLRPTPFTTEVQVDQSQNGCLKLGLNVTTLAHRALSKFKDLESCKDISVSWRLITDYIWQIAGSLPKFVLSHNKNDASQQHVFKGKNFNGSHFSLRPEQQRSLHWMVAQEDEPKPFWEQEIEEACLLSLGWRAEARATKACYVRGGVLADRVGYGKTITTLALIDSQRQKEPERFKDVDLKTFSSGNIALKATLILVPTTIIPQWENQAKKFLGKTYSILAIKSTANLNNCKISDFKSADIIIAPWSIFDNESYLQKLSRFGALPEAPPTTQGRAFAAWQTRIVENVTLHTKELSSSPFPVNFAQTLKDRLSVAENDENLLARVPSKRLRGKDYVASVSAKSNSKAGNATKSSKTKMNGKSSKSSNHDYFGLEKAKSLDNLQGPLFEMFTFHRLVVDEYTYISQKQSSSINFLKSSSRWALSGTPALGDFADVKSLAKFIGINLGVDDASRSFLKTVNYKAILKDSTTVEQFQSYDQAYSPAWHDHRHRHAQDFLDQFIRQNTAEIDEIPMTEKHIGITLPASERAAYLELQMQLCAQDMKIRKGNSSKLDSDRTRRLNELLDDCNTPEEALVRRCSTNIGDKSSNASDSCEQIAQYRKNQLEDVRRELIKNLLEAAALKQECGVEDIHYDRWKQSVRKGNYGDASATNDLKAMVDKAEKKSHSKLISKHKSVLELRNRSEHLHTLAREFVGRMRGARFLHNMRKFQIQQQDLSTALDYLQADCGHEVREPDDLAILGLCGHIVCNACLSNPDRGTQCPIQDCSAAAMDYHIYPILELGHDNMDATKKCHRGGKIEDIIRLVQQEIPLNDQILLFVQFDDLMNKFADALDEHKIPHLAITEKEARSTRGGIMMTDFQDETSAKKYKVLLLVSGHESSAGVNLTNANHVIFASPIIAQSQDEYDALDEQCIGRARRFGQMKMVYVYRFLALKTIDVDIIQNRSGKRLVLEDKGDYRLKANMDLTEKERKMDLGSKIAENLFSSEIEDD